MIRILRLRRLRLRLGGRGRLQNAHGRLENPRRRLRGRTGLFSGSVCAGGRGYPVEQKESYVGCHLTAGLISFIGVFLKRPVYYRDDPFWQGQPDRQGIGVGV